jgi:hypothetical protein
MDRKGRVESMTTALTEVLSAIQSDAMYADDPDDRPNDGEIARRALSLQPGSKLTPEYYEMSGILTRILEYSRGVRLFMPPDYMINQ